MPNGLPIDELQVVSDLHLGGRPGFQIFAAGAELAWLAQQVARSPVAGLAALVVNGDFIDFLAEEPALAFDPEGVIAKIDRVMADPAFAPVFAAFRALLATPNRLLVINLGNHDLELALPWARRHLAARLADDDAARARLLLVTDGTGFACQVGNARVLCLHGNEVDSWNVTDFEHLRRLGRDLQAGQSPAGWVPNAGSQLVVEVMNQVKRQYPFVDLLKPETSGVLPVLTALNPQLLRKLQDMVGVARRKATDAARMQAGFLDADAPGAGAPGGAGQNGPYGPSSPSSPSGPSSLTDLPPWALPPAAAPGQRAANLMAQADAAMKAGQDPMHLVHGQADAQLGVLGATWDWMTNKPRHEVLREALEYLDKDRSFALDHADDTFKAIDAMVGPGVDLLLTGHTHLERDMPRLRGGGRYYNTGTWAYLMRITPALRQDAARFGQFFKLLDGSDAATLQAALPDQVMQRNTVAAVWRGADGRARHELRHVTRSADGLRAVPLRDTPRTTG